MVLPYLRLIALLYLSLDMDGNEITLQANRNKWLQTERF